MSDEQSKEGAEPLFLGIPQNGVAPRKIAVLVCDGGEPEYGVYWT